MASAPDNSNNFEPDFAARLPVDRTISHRRTVVGIQDRPFIVSWTQESCPREARVDVTRELVVRGAALLVEQVVEVAPPTGKRSVAHVNRERASIALVEKPHMGRIQCARAVDEASAIHGHIILQSPLGQKDY